MDPVKRRRLVTVGLVLTVICVVGFILYLVWTMGLLDPWIDDVFFRDTSFIPGSILKIVL